MPASTPRGAPYPVATDNNDVPGDIQRLAEWVDLRPGISTLTTVQRDALAGVELWTGRVIFNTTTGLLERWNGAAWTDDVAPQYLTPAEGDAAYQAVQNEIYVSASRMSAVVGSPTLGILVGRHPVWLLDPAVVENVAGGIDVPAGWSSVHIDILWTKPGTGAAGDVQWTVSIDHAADGATLDATGPFVTIARSSPAQNVLRRTRPAGTVAVTQGGWSTLRVQRRAADATDTLAEDAALLGVRLVKAS